MKFKTEFWYVHYYVRYVRWLPTNCCVSLVYLHHRKGSGGLDDKCEPGPEARSEVFLVSCGFFLLRKKLFRIAFFHKMGRTARTWGNIVSRGKGAQNIKLGPHAPTFLQLLGSIGGGGVIFLLFGVHTGYTKTYIDEILQYTECLLFISKYISALYGFRTALLLGSVYFDGHSSV